MTFNQSRLFAASTTASKPFARGPAAARVSDRHTKGTKQARPAFSPFPELERSHMGQTTQPTRTTAHDPSRKSTTKDGRRTRYLLTSWCPELRL